MAKKAVSEILFDDFVRELQRIRALKKSTDLSDSEEVIELGKFENIKGSSDSKCDVPFAA